MYTSWQKHPAIQVYMWVQLSCVQEHISQYSLAWVQLMHTRPLTLTPPTRNTGTITHHHLALLLCLPVNPILNSQRHPGRTSGVTVDQIHCSPAPTPTPQSFARHWCRGLQPSPFEPFTCTSLIHRSYSRNQRASLKVILDPSVQLALLASIDRWHLTF
jgi:hypothetical protein